MSFNGFQESKVKIFWRTSSHSHFKKTINFNDFALKLKKKWRWGKLYSASLDFTLSHHSSSFWQFPFITLTIGLMELIVAPSGCCHIPFGPEVKGMPGFQWLKMKGLKRKLQDIQKTFHEFCNQL